MCFTGNFLLQGLAWEKLTLLLYSPTQSCFIGVYPKNEAFGSPLFTALANILLVFWGDEAQDESSLHRAEFQVFSSILSSWSEVFGKMMSDDFMEGKKKEVVIKDFSAKGVEAFLRFFHEGTLNISQVDVIVEVLVLADKYQVPELHSLCKEIIKNETTPQNAWTVFQSADKFQLEDERLVSKNLLFVKTKEALAQRPSVSDELLEEVLSSGLLCISDGELFSLLAKWKEAEEGLKKNIELIQEHVNMENVPPILIQQSGLDDESLRPLKTQRSRRSRGEKTEDVHDLLLRRFEEFLKEHQRPESHAEGSGASLNFQWGVEEGRRKAMWEANFLTKVQVSHTMPELPRSPYRLACNQNDLKGPFRLDAGTWIEWRLLRFALYLTGISLTGLEEAAHVEIWCGDGERWERIFCSEGKEIIKVKTFVPCHCDFMVRHFKIKMLQGSFDPSRVKFQGILQEAADWEGNLWRNAKIAKMAICSLLSKHWAGLWFRRVKCSETVRYWNWVLGGWFWQEKSAPLTWHLELPRLCNHSSR